jgi:Fic-DOC domain mobile mystery protein B
MPNWGEVPGETPIDPSGLVDPHIHTRMQLDKAESQCISKVMFRYFLSDKSPKSFLFDFSWALQLHHEMFGEVWEWAGRIRSIDLNIGVPCNQVETSLYDFFETIPYWQSMPLLEQVARIHHRAVQIHPFLNGNGRWSRILANIWQKQNSEFITIWPDAVSNVSMSRDEYLAALKAADHHQIEPLVALHQKYSQALDTIS